MVFSNLFFLFIFMPVLAILYFAVGNGKKWGNAYRRAILIAFSLLFYAWGEPVYVFLMVGMVAVNYLLGRLIDISYTVRMRRVWMILAIIIDLSILGVYKYLGFLTETVNTIFNVTIPVVSLSLPIGISFFTFQTMSYVIDVYRFDTDVQKNFGKLLLYVSFFPQLIAGPIVRYKDIEAQLEDRTINAENINEGLWRFAIGLTKKVLIADMCDTVVTTLYGLSDVTVTGRWLAALFYTLQLYFDFSGYSDMAIGLGRMFGFRFNENFITPLASHSATEFWRRWHISLGTFFRDYVYIPLGGNRHDQRRNIIVVWCLTGIWHGASWNFALWGLYYGVLLIIEKEHLLNAFKALPKVPYEIISHIYTVFITVFGFAIFYNETDLLKNLGYLFGIGADRFNDIFTASVFFDNIWLLIAACILAVPAVPKLTEFVSGKVHVSYEAQRIIKTVFVLAALSIAVIRLCGNSYSPFLYFRF